MNRPDVVIMEDVLWAVSKLEGKELAPPVKPKRVYLIAKTEVQFQAYARPLRMHGLEPVRVLEDAIQLRGTRGLRVFILHTGMDRWLSGSRRILYQMAKHGHHSLYKLTATATRNALEELTYENSTVFTDADPSL